MQQLLSPCRRRPGAGAVGATLRDERCYMGYAHGRLRCQFGDSLAGPRLAERHLHGHYRRMATTVDTPHGPARIHLREVKAASGAVVLGHGAGGGVESPDLVGAAAAARDAGLSVALVEQPYRVAGRRAPAPAAQLAAAWVAVVSRLFEGLPLVVGGRS